MLDEEEYDVIDELYSQAFRAAKDFSKNRPPETSIKGRFRSVCEAYKQMTGFDETNHNAIMHHRISIYGPPCAKCGKPLRTPRAAFCAACGTPREG
ncbi:MAG TPA: hypothetical protein VFD58_07555 [Blastocatellia bacterium]|nr:hypothetical protein [Blastocatellia bacterium]